MKRINDDYKHVSGSEQNYSLDIFPQLKYTSNIREIVIKNAIQHIVIPIIAQRFKKIPDTFQMWNLERIVEADRKTNNFLLTCRIESEYLNEISAEDVEILQYAECLYNLDINFDLLEMWLEYDTLLLPQEH